MRIILLGGHERAVSNPQVFGHYFGSCVSRRRHPLRRLHVAFTRRHRARSRPARLHHHGSNRTGSTDLHLDSGLNRQTHDGLVRINNFAPPQPFIGPRRFLLTFLSFDDNLNPSTDGNLYLGG